MTAVAVLEAQEGAFADIADTSGVGIAGLYFIDDGKPYYKRHGLAPTALVGVTTADMVAYAQPLDATLTALAAADWAANSVPIGTGANTVGQVAFAASTFPARASAGNLVAKPITDAGLAMVAAADAAAETALLNLATTALKGLMSATDKTKLDDLWVDATANTVAGGTISTGNSGATNSANLATLYAAVSLSTTIYVPPGTYDMSAELTCNRDVRLRWLGAGKGRSIFRSTSATANMFNQTVAGFYISFEELGFTASVTKTAGAAIIFAANNAECDVRRCEFSGQFRGIDLSSGGMNVGVINECIFDSPTAGGSQIRINGTGINMMVQNCTINVTGVNCAGVEINASGAVQIGQCDFIGGANTMLINATGIVAAVFCTNVFLDQATLGSTLKFMGTASISRVKFVQCGITNGGGSGLIACEIAGTGTGTGIPDAIDFVECDFYNNGFAGTTNGVVVTGCRAFSLVQCRISGFTVGVNITSYNAAGVTSFNITACKIGATENFATNGTAININAGSFTYGASQITANDLSGSTTANLTDGGAYVNNYLLVSDNFGLAMPPKAEVTNATIPLTTVTRAGSAWAIPGGTLRVGTHLQIRVSLTCPATAQTLTPTLKMGINNTNADTDLINNVALGASGGAAVGSMLCVYDILISSATTAQASAVFYNFNAAGTNTTGITNAAITGRGSAGGTTGQITITNISTAQFLAPYFASGVASAVVVRNVDYEVIAQ